MLDGGVLRAVLVLWWMLRRLFSLRPVSVGPNEHEDWESSGQRRKDDVSFSQKHPARKSRLRNSAMQTCTSRRVLGRHRPRSFTTCQRAQSQFPRSRARSVRLLTWKTS